MVKIFLYDFFIWIFFIRFFTPWPQFTEVSSDDSRDSTVLLFDI